MAVYLASFWYVLNVGDEDEESGRCMFKVTRCICVLLVVASLYWRPCSGVLAAAKLGSRVLVPFLVMDLYPGGSLSLLRALKKTIEIAGKTDPSR